jgi:hypothetical protein
MAQICRLYNDLRLAARTTESSKNLIFRVPDKSFTKLKRKNLMHACVHTYTERWQSRKTAKAKKEAADTRVERVTMLARIQSGASSPPHTWNFILSF